MFGDIMKEITLKQLKIHENRIWMLEEMNIHEAKDIVEHYPYRYEIMEETTLIPNEKCIIEGTLIDDPKIFFHGRVSRMTCSILYQNKTIKITIFNRHFLKRNMHIGMKVTVIGKYNDKNNSIVASDLKLQGMSQIQGIVPIYSLKKEITNKSFQGYVKKALVALNDSIEDKVPISMMIKHQLIHKKLALQLIHFPDQKESIHQALRYLKYEEFLKFQLTMQYIKLSRKKDLGIKKEFEITKIKDFIDHLPFKLTADQVTCVNELLHDLNREQMMYRFIQGDVGSGKTIVGAIGLYANYIAGYQGAFMAPTEILASQHYHSLKKLFQDTDIKIALLTGHLTNKQKQEIYEGLKLHTIDIVIGTHALFQEKVVYHNLGFVITDEQHRFGVNQRKALKEKGNQVDFLIMSATPIPRTLAISLYGDMDVSTIKTMPAGRKKVKTDVIVTKSMKPILKQLKDYLASGGQCYVVCPLVEEGQMNEVRDASSIYQAMKRYFEGSYEVDLLHGKMDDIQKEEVMQRFIDNETQILVSTTVIEVGIDVKNANMMVVYNAERFGLSQLHQLRGRIGRGDQEGYCYLLTSSTSSEARERLDFLKDCHDGFEISYYDLKLRGPGDILGQKQSGLPLFMIGDVFKDFDILEQSRKDALELLTSKSNDPVYLNLLKEIQKDLTLNNQYID